MLYTAVFMLVAVAAYIAISSFQRSEVPLQQNILAKEMGQGFAAAVTLAVKGGTGFSYNYSFPKTVFTIPYSMDFTRIDSNVIVLDWPGPYGNFSYQYDVPAYHYAVQNNGGCLSGSVLRSNECSNMLMFHNENGILTIRQLG